MPSSVIASKADQALAASASGAFLKSTGPTTVPTTVTLATSDVSGLDAALTAKADDTAVAKKSANLSDLASASTARSNLGLGSAATRPASDFATPADLTAKAGLSTANVFTQPQTAPLRDKGGARFDVTSFGATGDGVTDDIVAILAAVAAAKAQLAGGEMGATVFFPPGLYVISQPIVLPRTNSGPTGGLHVRGAGMLQSRISGSLSFPANRALIEWEQVAEVALFQRISDLYLYQSDAVNCRAIHYKITIPASDPASDTVNMCAERLMIELRNLVITSNNSVHPESIYLEGNVYNSVFKNIWGNPWVGLGANQYDTLLLRTDTQVGGSDDVHGSDPPGLSNCTLDNIQGGAWAGGFYRVFSGRTTRSVFANSFNQGGLRGPGWEFINSEATTLDGLANEGNGGSSLLRLVNCQNMLVQNFTTTGPTNQYLPVWTPSTAYSVGDFLIPTNANVAACNKSFRCTTAGTTGASEPTWSPTGTTADGTVVWTPYQKAYPDAIELVETTDCTFQNKNGFPGNPSFSSHGAKMIILDSDSHRNRFINFGIPGVPAVLSTEVEFADTATNRLESFDPSSPGSGVVFGAVPVGGNVVAPTADYTVVPGDMYLNCYPQAAPMTVTLPAINDVSEGYTIFVKNIATSGNLVSFALAPGNGFEYGAAPTVAGFGGWKKIVADRTFQWWLSFGNS